MKKSQDLTISPKHPQQCDCLFGRNRISLRANANFAIIFAISPPNNNDQLVHCEIRYWISSSFLQKKKKEYWKEKNPSLSHWIQWNGITCIYIYIYTKCNWKLCTIDRYYLNLGIIRISLNFLDIFNYTSFKDDIESIIAFIYEENTYSFVKMKQKAQKQNFCSLLIISSSKEKVAKVLIWSKIKLPMKNSCSSSSFNRILNTWMKKKRGKACEASRNVRSERGPETWRRATNTSSTKRGGRRFC